MAQGTTSSIVWGNYFEGRFLWALEELSKPSWIDKVAATFSSDQPSEDYRWLGQSPGLREWVGGRQEKTLRSQTYSLANKTWEATLGIDTDDLRRQKFNQINTRIDELAARAIQHKASLLTALIAEGDAATYTNAYDGNTFFNSSHSVGSSGTIDNTLTLAVAGDGSTPTAAEMEAGIIDMVEAIMGFNDDQGEPLNTEARKFLVMCPVNMMGAVAGALNTQIIADTGGGRTNVIAALGDWQFEWVVNPRLSTATELYLFRTDGSVKPFIYQTEKEPTSQTLDDSFRNHRMLFGVEASYNFGYGYFQQAVKMVLS